MTAAKEANQDFANDIADLRTAQSRTGESTRTDDFAGPWFAIRAPTNEPLSWDVARQFFGQGKAGSLVPRFHRGTTLDDLELVLWRWDESPAHQVHASDPSRRLLKDQL
jgi:RES domain-containing protein